MSDYKVDLNLEQADVLKRAIDFIDQYQNTQTLNYLAFDKKDHRNLKSISIGNELLSKIIYELPISDTDANTLFSIRKSYDDVIESSENITKNGSDLEQEKKRIADEMLDMRSVV